MLPVAPSPHTLRSLANDNDVASPWKRSSADGGVGHSRAFLLCTAVLFWLCWQWVIDPAWLVARNGHVRRWNRLARPPKSYPGIGPDRHCYAAAINVPIYLIGRWLGDPTSTSVAFTAIASVLGLLTFGSLTLVRRIWPQQPGHEKAPPPVRASAFHQRSRTSLRKSIA